MLIASSTGRIVHASDRLIEAFGLEGAAEPLPRCHRVQASAGRAAPDDGRRRGHPASHGAGGAPAPRARRDIAADVVPLTLITIESGDDLYLRGQLDALEEPVFAIGADGRLAHLNRSALTLFGSEADGGLATAVFAAHPAHWWEIAPLASARRLLDYRERRYCASIRRVRIAESAQELSFVQLAESRSAA